MDEACEKMEAVKKIDDQIEQLSRSRRELLSEWAEIVCPYSVGEEVDVRGYSHRGKRCRIGEIMWKYCFNGVYEWRVGATVLKKDGSPSQSTVDWGEGHEKRLS